jgi:hypothetical protein
MKLFFGIDFLSTMKKPVKGYGEDSKNLENKIIVTTISLTVSST